MKHIIDSIFDEVTIDPRIETGIFDISDNIHMEVLREHLKNKGFADDSIVEIHNIIVESGKFPERQAFNKDGLLVTFPTPEHKKRAIDRGTHFAENPKKANVNIFGGEQTGSQPQPAQAPQAPQASQASGSQQLQNPAAQTGSATPLNTNPNQRTPTEVSQDAVVVNKMLKMEYSLEEAKQLGFYHDNNYWYTKTGEKVGKLWFIENVGKTFILNI